MPFDYVAVNRRLLAFLKSGGNITANQARQKFGISNVSARVQDLRKAGYPIFCNSKKTSNGRTIRTYRLGTPTRRQIAAGFVGERDSYVRAQVDKNLKL